ncbi:MAG TPA: carbamoyltransferase N-terminal domain-containing protein, partial [Candidatus Hydrogenedentes bacterium]|nr:carbamoyltransferase N-terminal domain-containing protein [Candidatus Hydrogenedentota bacterium]
MNILGISAFYHDSAAALLRDGDILAAAQEERFSRKKHDPRFPGHAVEYCLGEGGITIDQVDYVAFYDKPLIKFERLLMTYLASSPHGYLSFLSQMPSWLKEKLFVRNTIRKQLGYQGNILFSTHHLSHAAAAFFPSPFEEAAFITVDGVGEWATTTYGIGRDTKVKILKEINFPHSLGLLYSAFTYFTGFKVNSGEYKLMGLAPYGEPRFVDIIKRELIDIRDDGSFRLNMRYFDYCAGLRMTNRRFADLFGGPERTAETKITQREMDLASSIQVVTEEVMLKMARHVQRETGMKKLVLAGGVALNCVANGKVLRDSPFEDIWIQPCAGDGGNALGAALFTWHQLLGNPRTVTPRIQKASYLGPSYSDDEIQSFLDARKIPYRKLSREDLPEVVADLLSSEKVVGWHQGRMEYGPRALGARSILGDPRSRDMQTVLNLKIKFRES